MPTAPAREPRPALVGRPGPGETRPLAFLVSTTPCARSIREHLGSPAYSYYFVVEALAPVLEAFGTWRLVDHPESRLAFAARKAEAEGYRPVHLAINPLQDVYLSPALPNVLFPFWEFPEIPDRAFGDDARQNWVRACRPAALVLTACGFTAAAFRRAGVNCPVGVVPIPVPPGAFDLPDWDRSHAWTLTCRHEVLGPVDAPSTAPASPADEPSPEPEGPPRSAGERAWRGARWAFRRVHPWMNPETVGKITRVKRRIAWAARQPKRRLAFAAVRDGYRRYVRRWLSLEALETVTGWKRSALALVGREPTAVPDPPLPSGELTLGGGGLVYLTIFNIGDRRKNHLDILTAFLDAFRDRPDATLVLKLVTNPLREHHEAGVLRAQYRAIGTPHRCRVVVITEFLDDAGMDDLFRATTYYVNASHAEGACLPLMRALAGGRPAVAPNHTAMADYVDDAVGFVPRAFPEPTYWPHDPEQRLETTRYRLVWSDLRDAFLESADVADRDPARYEAMAAAARSRIAVYAGRDAAERALRAALADLPGAS